METVFWPGITTATHAPQNLCPDSHHNAPCQPHAPPYPVQVPEYFFQCIGTNFFHYQGTQYLVTVDHY